MKKPLNLGKLLFAVWVIVLFVLAFNKVSSAGHLNPEKYYQQQWCEHRGQMEVALPDGTRVDCLTQTSAVEMDFAPKWTEAIGQSLYYSLQTGKRAGIVLIMESEKDVKYLIRMNSTIKHFGLPIDVWYIGDGAIK